MLEVTEKNPVTPKRVTILGGGGFIGSALARHLAEKAIAVQPITRAQADFCQPHAIEILSQLIEDGDVVVNAAAIAPCKDLDQLGANILMIKHIQAALKGKAFSHLVNISSDAVYGDLENPITEMTPLAPGSFHGIMHLAREVAINTQGGGPITHVRPTLIYGSHDPHNGYGPNRFARQAIAREDISLFGKGEERRDHIFIDDLIRILWLVISHRAVGTVNVATGQTHSFRALADLCVKLAQSPSKISYLERQGPMPHNGLRPFDVRAILQAFPDFRFTSIEDGMRKVEADLKRRDA